MRSHRNTIVALVVVLAAMLAQPAQAEAPTINQRVAHLEASMDALLYQLENCIPRAVPFKTVTTKRGKETLYVAALNDKQRRICFSGH